MDQSQDSIPVSVSSSENKKTQPVLKPTASRKAHTQGGLSETVLLHRIVEELPDDWIVSSFTVPRDIVTRC